MQLSSDINADPSTLIPVPEFLFQGSIALGSLCEAVLGPATGGKQLVHPLLIAGWCGLLTQVRCSACWVPATELAAIDARCNGSSALRTAPEAANFPSFTVCH